MSQAIQSSFSLPKPVQQLYLPVQDHLLAAEDLLRSELRNEDEFVNELLQYGNQLGGKRLRPALLLLTAQAVGAVHEAHYRLAAVVEMIHTATLIHDDVLDEADMRRHLATVNARWNNETSVLLGDYLFSHAFYLASTVGDTYACRRIGRSTNIVCEGELRQVSNRANYGLTESQYLSIVNGKTAELCACACHLGAHYAGGSRPVVDAMEQYGRDLGMAFQIADDLLDITGEEKLAGKSLGTDLQKQKLTLPWIHCLQHLPADRRETLVQWLSNRQESDLNQSRDWLQETGSIDYASRMARRLAAEAQEQLTSLPNSPEKRTLADLTGFVVDRSL